MTTFRWEPVVMRGEPSVIEARVYENDRVVAYVHRAIAHRQAKRRRPLTFSLVSNFRQFESGEFSAWATALDDFVRRAAREHWSAP